MESVKLIECPRDAWQGLPRHVPVERKVEYLRALVDAGFRHIDAASFVSPKAVPQMADSEDVLAQLGRADGVEIIGIVVNEKGAERAIATGAVSTLGFPFSISETFLRRNQNQSLEENRMTLQRISERAQKAGLQVVAYISMAFGNPYGDAYDAEEVVAAVDVLEASGITMISLADTVGISSPEQVGALVSAVKDKFSYLEIGVHLHSRAEHARAKILAAYDAGCRRFDSALGGLGGCPFAQDMLVGNIATEVLLETLRDHGAELPPLKPLDVLLRASKEIGARYTASHGAD